MSISAEKKRTLITEYSITERDTGSVEVQAAILTERINNLTQHLLQNKHDYPSRRSLLIMVSRRRRLINYLQKNNLSRYRNLINRLGLRK